VLWTLGGLLTLATLVTVAIHIAPVRRAFGMAPLGQSSAGGGCPFGYGKDDGASAALTPRVPRALPADMPRAAARPALGFAFHVTTRAEVQTWAVSHGITCTTQRAGLQLSCQDIPATLVGGDLAVASAWLSFASDGTLQSLRTVRKTADVTQVASAFDHTRGMLTSTVGQPKKDSGDVETTRLAANLLAQSAVEYHFADYRADLRATHLDDGFVLSESYIALD